MAPPELVDGFPAVMSLSPNKVDQELLKKGVGAVRQKFNEQYADNISSGVYDQRDLDRLETNDDYASCFLLNGKTKGDLTKAVNNVDEVFKYRKELGIWDWKDEDFPQEIWDTKGIFYHGQDRKGNRILQIRNKTYTPKSDEQVATAKKFLAWHFEKHHREKAGVVRVVVLSDMEGAGLANVNMEMSKYMTTLFDLFPSFGIYVMTFEMPWLLNAFLTAVKFFLNDEQKSRMISVTKSDITTYIPEEHLLDHQKERWDDY